MAPVQPPPWHTIYPRGTPAAWLTDIITSHARSALAADSTSAAEVQADTQDSMNLDGDVDDDNNSAATPDGDAIPPLVPHVDIDAPVESQLAYAGSRVWRKHELRPVQHTATNKLVYDKESGGKLLVVDRTGGGKSLILQLSAVMVGGIIYVIIPLLALTANQIAKLKQALQAEGRVQCHHLDEINPQSIKDKLIPRMDRLEYDSSTTLFLLSSPHYLADNVEFRDCLIRCKERQTLRLVCLDEVHLYTMHGRTFRECIRYLEKVFFSVVFSERESYHPLFLSMTATMTQSILKSFSTLTCVDWSQKQHQSWAPASSFRQRYIKMTFDVTGDITAVALPRLVTHMKRNPDSYAAIYVNFKYECSK